MNVVLRVGLGGRFCQSGLPNQALAYILGGQGAFSTGALWAGGRTPQLWFLLGFTLTLIVLEEMAVASQSRSEGLFWEKAGQWHLKLPPPQEDT